MGLGRKLSVLLAIFAVSALIGWWIAHDPTPDYRYRLTVEVETPEGLKAGSSVIQVETAVSRGIPTPGAVRSRVRGEAVAVDLPGGKTLFALLRSENDIDWASRVMFMMASEVPKTDEDQFQSRFNNLLRLNGSIALPRMWPPVGHLDERSAYPMMVTFRDLADPVSVQRVDPDDLAATFGEGVRLKRITVQMTDDAVTSGIRNRLRWLGDYPEPSLDPDHGSRDFSLPATLRQGDFLRRSQG